MSTDTLEVFPGCIENEAGVVPSTSKTQLPKKVLKKFSDVVYNQLFVDPYACTVVATAGALTSYTGKKVPYELMTNALSEMKKVGLFVDGIGAFLKDGVYYMVKEYNSYYKTNITPHLIKLDESSIFNSFDKYSSPVVTGIRVGRDYFKDEQDNATIDKGVLGNIGHAIYICKINTMDATKFQMKYVESYEGKATEFGEMKDIIYVDFTAHNNVFFNTGYYFTGK